MVSRNVKDPETGCWFYTQGAERTGSGKGQESFLLHLQKNGQAPTYLPNLQDGP